MPTEMVGSEGRSKGAKYQQKRPMLTADIRVALGVADKSSQN